MIKYALPGAFEHCDLNFFILDLYKNHKEYFNDDVEIEICYGNPKFCIWDGGRISPDYIQMSSIEVKDIINIYNKKFDIPIRYVFTNQDLKEEHYNNRFCNLITNLANDYHNEIVLADDNLYEYLFKRYKNIQFVSSTTKCITSPIDAINELHNDKFKLVCLDYNLNHNLDFLNSLSEKEKQKTEILINILCPLGCPYKKEHFHLQSLSNLQYSKPFAMEYCAQMTKKENLSIISYEDIVNIYSKMGFEHFKLEGRSWNDLDLLLQYLSYLIKPEYHQQILSKAYNIICK